MSRVTQSKAQTEANAKLLRSLVKSADNKVCVDCKKNDPRWASWNLGCFLCIRCSGIHRSMGTHISKVKSIDLDIWTPEQMESVQKWGNRRCNLYWEAHLKIGHVPADHKIESFIRSKYESRRWAKDGPVPNDPSSLDGENSSDTATATVVTAVSKSGGSADITATGSATSNKQQQKQSAIDLLDDPTPSASQTVKTQISVNKPTSQTSTTTASAAAALTSNKPSNSGVGGGGGIFDLDWHEPSATSPTSSNTTGVVGGNSTKGKNDIMSLFGSKPSAPAPALASVSSSDNAYGDFGSFSSALPTTNNNNTAIAGKSGLAADLNTSFGGLDLGSSAQQNNVNSSSNNANGGFGLNPWSSGMTTNATSAGGGSGARGGLFDTQDVWGSSINTTTATTTSSTLKPKDDAFADIWGDFK
ncbi:related to AGE2 - ADP-ribosylation factor and GTPase activating protein effector [Melanopsichium pennsylvanicum]|uniref:Related to AGE2 - ADP-ribosylation factor and GTPase activating protein effector n=2 Tax=Melanopsichium pennsylvanicum TaxID=63383 RepID=A0AAJ5C5D3_9BASI|nr:ap-domain-containing protein [Melanopsichium pennsylvanicum 4]SNX84616.1 related to AGE2 - ADP-ribosylation factor and GTPase activating protein effector [Melanopsichium pennsylvanicum]